MNRKLMFIFVFLLLIPGQALAGPQIEATAGVLMNARTGEVLWEKNAHQSMYPASTTKILTTLLLLENAAPDDTAVASQRASHTRGSSLYLNTGQEILVNDLLYGLMLQSANDGSVVAAEHVAGSVEAFAVMMNMKAKQLGALNTHFTNPHGLPDENHLTTAYDLAMITRYAMANPRFREIAAARRHTLTWPGDEPKLVVNRIPLMRSYDGMLGVKSGYTQAARHTFVGAAERDGMELIAVVLQTGGTQLWEETAALLDYGFTQFSSTLAVEAGDSFGPVDVSFGEPIYLQAAETFEFTHTAPGPEVTLELHVDEIAAPVIKGDILGEVFVLANGEVVGSVAVVAAQNVGRAVQASSWFWLWSGVLAVAGLRVRKIYRRRRKRKKAAGRKREYRQVNRKF